MGSTRLKLEQMILIHIQVLVQTFMFCATAQKCFAKLYFRTYVYSQKKNGSILLEL